MWVAISKKPESTSDDIIERVHLVTLSRGPLTLDQDWQQINAMKWPRIERRVPPSSVTTQSVDVAFFSNNPSYNQKILFINMSRDKAVGLSQLLTSFSNALFNTNIRELILINPRDYSCNSHPPFPVTMNMACTANSGSANILEIAFCSAICTNIFESRTRWATHATAQTMPLRASSFANVEPHIHVFLDECFKHVALVAILVQFTSSLNVVRRIRQNIFHLLISFANALCCYYFYLHFRSWLDKCFLQSRTIKFFSEL